MASEVSLLGNRWLFQHLSLSLDQRVLSSLGNARLMEWPVVYGLNLNLSTIKTNAFTQFADHIAGHAGLSVEVQVLDVLADSRGYFAAHKRLHENGHAILIDGLSALSLQFMDVTQFKADLYKLHWSPEMGDREHGDQVAAGLNLVGMEKIVLGRCNSEAAIQWGLAKGIQRFQGRYVDAMLAAYTMEVCDKSRPARWANASPGTACYRDRRDRMRQPYHARYAARDARHQGARARGSPEMKPPQQMPREPEEHPSSFDPRAERLVGQEPLLLDYVRKLERHRRGRQVAIIHLSGLQPAEPARAPCPDRR